MKPDETSHIIAAISYIIVIQISRQMYNINVSMMKQVRHHNKLECAC